MVTAPPVTLLSPGSKSWPVFMLDRRAHAHDPAERTPEWLSVRMRPHAACVVPRSGRRVQKGSGQCAPVDPWAQSREVEPAHHSSFGQEVHGGVHGVGKLGFLRVHLPTVRGRQHRGHGVPRETKDPGSCSRWTTVVTSPGQKPGHVGSWCTSWQRASH